MADTQRTLRFIRPWQNYRIGDEVTPSGTQRDWLIGHGYCELLPDKKRARTGSGSIKGDARANLAGTLALR